jgi:hypothetical protein
VFGVYWWLGIIWSRWGEMERLVLDGMIHVLGVPDRSSSGVTLERIMDLTVVRAFFAYLRCSFHPTPKGQQPRVPLLLNLISPSRVRNVRFGRNKWSISRSEHEDVDSRCSDMSPQGPKSTCKKEVCVERGIAPLRLFRLHCEATRLLIPACATGLSIPACAPAGCCA